VRLKNRTDFGKGRFFSIQAADEIAVPKLLCSLFAVIKNNDLTAALFLNGYMF